MQELTKMANDKRRVLHLYRRFNPDFTGDGIYYTRLLEIVSRLDSSLHEILVFDRPSVPTASSVPYRVHYITKDNKQGGTSFKLFFWIIRHVWNFDLIHVHTHVDRYFISYLFSRAIGCKIMYSSTLEDSVDDLIAGYRLLLRPIARKLFKSINAFVAISPRLFSGSSTAIETERAVLIPQGVHLPREVAPAHRSEIRTRLGLSENDVALLYVGSISQRKDVLFLVEEFVCLRKNLSNIRLFVVGPTLDRKYERRIKTLAKTQNVDQHIFWIPFTQTPEDYYLSSDIFVFSSLSEGFGNVLLEAMSFAIPVVSRYLNGVTSTFIEHEHSGFLFSDGTGFRSAISRLAADKQLRRLIGQAGYEVVQKRYALDNIASRISGLYRSIIETGRPLEDDSDPVPPACSEVAKGPGTLGMKIIDLSERIPTLSIVVDTESEFEWSKGTAADHGAIQSILRLPEFQNICDQFGTRVCYVVDYPVASTPVSAIVMRELIDRGAEIGAHLQPWSTPPVVEAKITELSFPGNLPATLEKRKLILLKQTIQRNLGVIPRIHKAGRYGISSGTLIALEELDFDVDLSVAPNFDYTVEDGPDFNRFTSHIYSFGNSRMLLEIPTTSSFVGVLSSHGKMLWNACETPLARRIHLRGVLDRIGLLSRTRLSPEGYTVDEMVRLTHYLIERNCRHFTLSLHSSSLLSGYTPYSSNEDDIKDILERVRRYLKFFYHDLGGSSCTPLELFDLVNGDNFSTSSPDISPSGRCQ